MVKLNSTQTMHIANVRTARTALRNAKAFSAARAKAIVADEIGGIQAALDYQVRLAFDAGIPKAQLRRDGLGTTDSKTLEDILKRTEGAAAALAGKIESDPMAHRYKIDAETGVLTITLTGQALTEAGAAVDAVAPFESSADFLVLERGDGTHHLKSLTPGHDADYNPHPIVTWGRVPENAAEALAWFEGREAA